MKVGKFEYIWIWIWYNDTTRLFILLGVPVIPVVFLAYVVFGEGEYLATVAILTYAFFFAWGLIDNDYSNLRKIGMNEYRKKIK